MVTQLQPDVRAYLHGAEVIKRYIRLDVKIVCLERWKLTAWRIYFLRNVSNGKITIVI